MTTTVEVMDVEAIAAGQVVDICLGPKNNDSWVAIDGKFLPCKAIHFVALEDGTMQVVLDVCGRRMKRTVHVQARIEALVEEP